MDPAIPCQFDETDELIIRIRTGMRHPRRALRIAAQETEHVLGWPEQIRKMRISGEGSAMVIIVEQPADPQGRPRQADSEQGYQKRESPTGKQYWRPM